MKKPFSLTYVTYEEGDVIGKLFAVITLSPIFLVVAMVTLILSRRDLHTALFFAWQLANEALNMGLKRVIRQPRPAGSGKSDFGMPSDHAQFMSFAATYFALLLVLRCKMRHRVWAFLFALASLAFAALVSFSRVYLGYHTVEQVVVGACVGASLALVAFPLSTQVILPVLRPLLRTRLARYLLVRDLSTVDNVLLAEFRAAHGTAKDD